MKCEDYSIYKAVFDMQVKIAENRDELIVQTIREIGGEKFYEVTIDRNKVIEALTMYQNKDKYAEVKHGEWIKEGNKKTCSVCGFFYHSNNDDWNGCPNCLAKMDGRK